MGAEDLLDDILLRHMIKPHRDRDFVVNLSYRLGIGEDYETWQAEEANWHKGSEVKARQMLKMWRSRKGKEATTQSMVSELKRMQKAGTPVQDIVDEIESHANH